MLLDNLFPLIGMCATTTTLFGILAFVGIPAVASIVKPRGYRRVSPRL